MTEVDDGSLTIIASVNFDATILNKVLINSYDYKKILTGKGATNTLNIGKAVFIVVPNDTIKKGTLPLSLTQRMASGLSVNSVIKPTPFYVSMSYPLGYNIETYLLMGSADIEVNLACEVIDSLKLSSEELQNHMINYYHGHIFIEGQDLLIRHEDKNLHLIMKNIKSQNPKIPKHHYYLNYDTKFNFISKNCKIIIDDKISEDDEENNNIFTKDFTFESLGVGGLDEQFKNIIRRIFITRLVPRHIFNALGQKHVKGMLLYGPPGCGKTLIARQIGKILNSRTPKIVNGPEILNKYIGQSEENIRELFLEAEKEQELKGDNSKLHVIIFDEFDAICKQRGSGGSLGTATDSVVNQLLTKIDGINSLNNILLIGLTNRKDMIDEAILRPGRFEVHIEITLPSEEGRLQILNIHTKEMKEHKLLDDNIDLTSIAKRAINFSGAELEALVKNAASYVLYKKIDINNLSNIKNVDFTDIKITQEDFELSFEEINKNK